MFCFAIVGGRGLSGSSDVSHEQIVAIAQSQIGIREATGNNDGPEVEAYLASVGLKKGEPWCAAFLSWVFKKGGYSAPVTGWSPALFPSRRLVKIPAPGVLFGVYFPSLKRIAHCGVVERVNGNWLSCVEGNTNTNGSRNGDGVYRKLRHVKTIYRYSDWINNNSKKKGAAL
ncbi:hypothetical protein SAMN04488101_1189 [Pedobacter nyackensis]|uniref:CHAP domain-containing protein n=2 Tax=Pedobacter nyackensis TaxID=475255 RepID=A0A1W2EZC4_9SPHI|nr:hypothetical protein SAMN04488101_1189 [Pedobacter nyackensis]